MKSDRNKRRNQSLFAKSTNNENPFGKAQVQDTQFISKSFKSRKGSNGFKNKFQEQYNIYEQNQTTEEISGKKNKNGDENIN